MDKEYVLPAMNAPQKTTQTEAQLPAVSTELKTVYHTQEGNGMDEQKTPDTMTTEEMMAQQLEFQKKQYFL